MNRIKELWNIPHSSLRKSSILRRSLFFNHARNSRISYLESLETLKYIKFRDITWHSVETGSTNLHTHAFGEQFEFVRSDIAESKDGSEGEYGDWVGVRKGWGVGRLHTT